MKYAPFVSKRSLALVGWICALVCLPALSAAQTGVTTIVSLTLDDSFDDQFAVDSMLAPYGIKATFFVNSGRLDQAGYMTQAQLETLRSNGHEIAGHTVS